MLITQKPSIIYIKFDDTKAGQNLTRTSGNNFAKENTLVPVQPLLTRIKLHSGKASSLEVQRIQFPISLACPNHSFTISIHKSNQMLVFDERGKPEYQGENLS